MGVLVVSIAFVLGAFAPSPRAFGASADLKLSPAAANLFIGGPDIAVGQSVGAIPAGPGLGGFDLTYTYDPALVDVELAPGSLLASTGRTVACVGSQAAVNQARIVCTSTGAASGATGSGVLVLLSVHVVAGTFLRADGNSTALVVLDTSPNTTTLSDVQGHALAVSRTADVLVTVRALEGDVTGDCSVDIFDEQAILLRLGTTLGDLLYSTRYDLVPAPPDGQINTFDLQFILGRLASTCASPNPSQEPRAVNPKDADDDEVLVEFDNCPGAFNPDQANADGNNAALGRAGQDLLGDACDSDADGDGYRALQEAALAPPRSDLVYCDVMRADIDGDGRVSILDVAIVASSFGQSIPPAPERGNQDGDDAITIIDIVQIASVFLRNVSTCP